MEEQIQNKDIVKIIKDIKMRGVIIPEEFKKRRNGILQNSTRNEL